MISRRPSPLTSYTLGGLPSKTLNGTWGLALACVIVRTFVVAACVAGTKTKTAVAMRAKVAALAMRARGRLFMGSSSSVEFEDQECTTGLEDLVGRDGDDELGGVVVA